MSERLFWCWLRGWGCSRNSFKASRDKAWPVRRAGSGLPGSCTEGMTCCEQHRHWLVVSWTAPGAATMAGAQQDAREVPTGNSRLGYNIQPKRQIFISFLTLARIRADELARSIDVSGRQALNIPVTVISLAPSSGSRVTRCVTKARAVSWHPGM